MLKQGVFKYFFVLGFIILLIVTYIVFYDKNNSKTEVQDKTSTTSTLIKDLRLGIAELDSLNPLVSNNKNIKEISRLIFDSLIQIGNNYELQFGLATGIAKENDLTYILTLRQNVKWQDGSDFTAQDVKFTIDTINDTLKNVGINSSYSTNLKYVTGLEIIDDYTVKIYLSQPQEFFEYNLTMPILCKSYFEGEDVVNTVKNNNIVGTGMFRISEVSEKLIKLVPNENYWNKDKIPLLTQIDVNLYDNIGQMYNAFKSGYIDIMDVAINDIQNYIGSLGYTKLEIPQRDVVFLSINTRK